MGGIVDSIGGAIGDIGDKVFGSDLGKIDPVLGLQSGYGSAIGNMFGDISGSNASKAANSAAKLQYKATIKGIKEQKRARESYQKLLKPYVEQGYSANELLQPILNDPTGYLQNNPLFQAAIDNTSGQLKNQAAARGKFGSGGMVNALFQNYLGQGQQFLNNDFNRIFNVSQMGQNAAAGVGSNSQGVANSISNLLGQGANAQASGLIGGANAEAQGTQNLLGLAALAASFFSDSRLKENIKYLYTDDQGIDIYSWDWNEEGKRIAGGQPTQGPIAQELMKAHPYLVKKDPETGYLMVKYERAA